jgi:hypothetical protein
MRVPESDWNKILNTGLFVNFDKVLLKSPNAPVGAIVGMLFSLMSDLTCVSKNPTCILPGVIDELVDMLLKLTMQIEFLNRQF